MSALVIDTSVWISYFAGAAARRGEEIDRALEEARVHLPPIVAAELLSGRMLPKKRRALEDLLADLPLCVCDLDHWMRVGRLRDHLRSRGLTVSTPDTHVAQCALDLEADLMSEDHIFSRIGQHRPLQSR